MLSKPSESTTSLSDSQLIDPTFVVDVDGEFLIEVIVTDSQGESSHSHLLVSTDIETSVDSTSHNNNLPTKYTLYHNYSNPFNPSTKIRFDVPRQSEVKIVIYNVLGQRIRTLIDREMAPGTCIEAWNGRDNNGIQVASGVYFYRMQAGRFLNTKKLLILR